MAPFVDVNLDDVNEPAILPEGRYDLVIRGGETKLSKSNRLMRVYRIAAVNPPEGKAHRLIYHNVMSPRKRGDTNKDGTPVEDWQIENDLLQLKRFCAAFGIDPNDPIDNHTGCEAENIMVQVVPVTDQHGNETEDTRNEIRFPRA